MLTKLNASFFTKSALILIVAAMLNGCGFQLRGYATNQLTQTNLVINHSDGLMNDIAYRQFERILKHDLKNAGANLVDTLAEQFENKNNLQINLYKLSFSSQGISRDATGRAYEQVITARLDYQLNPASLEPVESEKTILTLKASSNYFQDYRNPAAGEVQKKQTETLLIQQLSQNLIRQIEFQSTL